MEQEYNGKFQTDNYVTFMNIHDRVLCGLIGYRDYQQTLYAYANGNKKLHIISEKEQGPPRQRTSGDEGDGQHGNGDADDELLPLRHAVL